MTRVRQTQRFCTFANTKPSIFYPSHRKSAYFSAYSSTELSPLNIAINTIKTAETLVPYSQDAVNLGTLIWDLIYSIPSTERSKMLDQLSDSDIIRMWRLAGERNKASFAELAVSKVTDYSIWEDMPKQGREDRVNFRGRAVLPLAMGNFEKEIFHFDANAGESDQAERDESQELYGRVCHSGLTAVIKDVVYPGPLYFKVATGSSIVPMFSDTCDLVFSYGLGKSCMEEIRSVAMEQGWRAPRARNPPPFDCSYTDYIRVVGPGVFVGLGYGDLSKNTGVSSLIPRPLFFLMIRNK